MAWTEIMTSAHAALARAEWAFEDGNGDQVVQEALIATAQAMLAWLRAHNPSAPIWYDYASVLRDFGAATDSGSCKGVLSLHFQLASLDVGTRGLVPPETPDRTSPSTDKLRAILEATHGALRSLEGELKGEGQCGD